MLLGAWVALSNPEGREASGTCFDTVVELPGGVGCSSMEPLASDVASDKLKRLLCQAQLSSLQSMDPSWRVPVGTATDVRLSDFCPAACGAHGVGRCAPRANTRGTAFSHMSRQLSISTAGTSSGAVPAAADMQAEPLHTQSVPVDPSPGVSNVVFTLIRSGLDAAVFIERSKCLARSLSDGPLFDQ
eukprot:3344322-Prymnesium_polylepis.1